MGSDLSKKNYEREGYTQQRATANVRNQRQIETIGERRSPQTYSNAHTSRVEFRVNDNNKNCRNPEDSQTNDLYPCLNQFDPTTRTQNLGAYSSSAFSQPSTSGIQTHDFPRDNMTIQSPQSAARNQANADGDFIFLPHYRNSPQTNIQPTAPPRSINNIGNRQVRPVLHRARDSSTSGKASRAQKSQREVDNLSCPSCGEHFGIEIYQCPSGHSACNTCKHQGVRCAECGQNFTEMRNYALQDYASERTIACPNKDDGCRLFFKVMNISNHLQECIFGNMDCPVKAIFGRCTWQGKVSDMLQHFEDYHPEHRQGEPNKEMTLRNVYHDDRVVHFVAMGSFAFLVHVRVSTVNRVVYMAVQLIGSQISANKWTYEFHVYNKRQPRRKYQYTDKCHAIGEPVGTIFTEEKCVVLPLTYLETFTVECGLNYKFFIKKEDGKKFDGPNRRFAGPRKGQVNSLRT